MIGIIIAILVLLIVLFIAYKVRAEVKNAENAIETWIAPKSDLCKTDTAGQCGKMMVHGDKKSWYYPVSQTARFINYVSTGNKSMLSGNNYTLVSYREDQNIPMAIVYHDYNYDLVVIRGTMTTPDLMADLKYSQAQAHEHDPAMKIHGGIYEVYKSIKHKLLNSISKNAKVVTIVGHSLGSAIGELLAYDLAIKMPDININLAVIAPPRVGNRRFVKSLEAKIGNCKALINLADIVPTIPWTYMPSFTSPYTPDQFSQLTDVTIVNFTSTDIVSTHSLISYYNGLRTLDLKELKF